MAEYNFRFARETDLEALHNLFTSAFGSKRPVEYERWRYLGTPEGIAPIYVACNQNGEIVASYTVWPITINIGGESVKGAQAMDTMTHADYQGQGLFKKLASACYPELIKKGYEVLYGFPNEQAYPGCIKRLNWHHVANPKLYTRLITPLYKKPALLEKMSFYAASFLPRASTNGLRLKAGQPNDAALQDLINKIPNARGIITTERSADWLKWRYAPPEDPEYEWWTIYKGEIPLAYCVIGQKRSKPGECYLAELAGSAEALKPGLSLIVQMLSERGVKNLKAICHHPDLEPALKANGFLKRGDVPLIVKPLTTRILNANIHEPSSWRIFGGDFDVF